MTDVDVNLDLASAMSLGCSAGIACYAATHSIPTHSSFWWGEQRAAMVFSDPPYNVLIDGYASALGAIHHRPFPMASGWTIPSSAPFSARLFASRGVQRRLLIGEYNFASQYQQSPARPELGYRQQGDRVQRFLRVHDLGCGL
jgi:hypothetical protein